MIIKIMDLHYYTPLALSDWAVKVIIKSKLIMTLVRIWSLATSIYNSKNRQ